MKPGVLILHGFTSSLDCVNGLVPYVEKEGLPYRMPVLRGHGTVPEDLEGVTWRDWYEDAENALKDLMPECDKAIVVGLSMGALLSLQLAMEHGDLLDSIVLVSVALRLTSPLAPHRPLAFLTPLVGKLIKYFPVKTPYADKELEKFDNNYHKAPTKTIISFLEYTTYIEKRLPEVNTPTYIIHSRNDKVADPVSAQIVYDRISSREKEIRWFEKSGHEMMRDMEREEVFKAIMEWIRRRTTSAAQEKSA